MSGFVTGAKIVGGVLLGSAIISSSAAKSAAKTQAEAAREAGTTSLEGLQLQLAADKENVDKQIAAQKEALSQTLASQEAAAAAGNAAAAAALERQLAAQKEALDAQLGLQRELYQKQVENLSSFKQAGEAGQNRLLDILGLSGNVDAPGYGSAAKSFSAEDMEQDPGYAFRLSEGQKAIERSTAARGGLQSGAALKAAARYGQEMGSQEYANAFNRYQTERANKIAPLQSLQAVGQASAAGQAAAAGNLASGSSQALQNYGSGASGAYGSYGAAQGQIAAQQGAGASAAYSGYGSNLSNIYGSSNQARQSAYGANTANQIGAITGAGNAMSAGKINSANAFTNAASQGMNLFGMYNQNQLAQQYISRLPPVAGSDVAIKENIRKIGVLENGLNVYEYEYKAPYKATWGHGQQIGVMAQEVEQIIPEAVSVHPDGYKMVDYSMIH